MRKLALFLLLAACQPQGWVLYPPATPPGPDDCGAKALAGLGGQPVSALPGQGPWSALRVIRPGDAVTEDYSPSRLNVELDAQDRIAAVRCG